MGEIHVNQDVKYASLAAVVTRADGTVEDLGVIAEFKRPEETTSSMNLIDKQNNNALLN